MNKDRIARLRERAVMPVIAREPFYLHFFRRYRENTALPSAEARYADAYTFAFQHIEPEIDEEELIVGKASRALTEAERREYTACIEHLKPELPEPVGQDSHMAIDYERLLQDGLVGVIARIDALSRKTYDPQARAFYDACRRCLKAVDAHAQWYADCAAALAAQCPQADRKRELETIARICARVPRYPAASFYEAVQAIHFLSHCLSFDPLRYFAEQQFQLGHIDRYLYPYYRADSEAGRLTEAFAQTLLDCLGIQINHRVPRGLSAGYMVGGHDADGHLVANELTRMGMQVVDDIRLVYPSVGLCYTEDLPEPYLAQACDILSHGCSHPAIFNDAVITRGLIGYGVPEREAHTYIHSTCVEITPVGSSNVWVASPYTNLPQLLLDALEEEPPTFAALSENIYARLAASIRHNFEQQNQYRQWRADKGQNPLLSCFVHDCLEQGRDIERGGARYNWIMPSFVGMANLVDSLYAVKRMVYEERRLPLKDLRDSLHRNFEGDEALRLTLLHKLPKYGNDDDDIDRLAIDITRFIVEECRKYQPIFPHARLIPSVFCWIMHETFGSQTGATPDGRKAGFPLGDGSGACQGREKNGPLASLLSSTKWPHTELIGGVAVNMKFSKKQFAERSYQAMIALIKTYMERGGFEIQINVIDRDTLLDAIEHPEDHRDLVVRIGGYSDYFVHLSPNMQQEVLLRTEHDLSV